MASMMETDIVPTTNGVAAPAPPAAPPSQALRVNDRLADALKLEHQLIKVCVISYFHSSERQLLLHSLCSLYIPLLLFMFHIVE